MMDLVRDQGQAPVMGAPGFGDHSSAMSLFGAIMLALYRRERTGEGSFVETSLLANGVWANGMQVQGAIAGFDLGRIRQEKGLQNPFTSVYATADGRHLLLASINVMKEWPRLCRALEREAWLDDERLSDQRTLMRNRLDLKAMMMEVFAKLSLEDRAHAVGKKWRDLQRGAEPRRGDRGCSGACSGCDRRDRL